MLRTDIAPPTTRVLARISDPRAVQFWDEGRLLSQRLLQTLREHGDPVPADGVAWDLVALYPPGLRWEGGAPRPDFEDAPVVDTIDVVRRRLAAATATRT